MKLQNASSEEQIWSALESVLQNAEKYTHTLIRITTEGLPPKPKALLMKLARNEIESTEEEHDELINTGLVYEQDRQLKMCPIVQRALSSKKNK